jgi:hypothetical protein
MRFINALIFVDDERTFPNSYSKAALVRIRKFYIIYKIKRLRKKKIK